MKPSDGGKKFTQTQKASNERLKLMMKVRSSRWGRFLCLIDWHKPCVSVVGDGDPYSKQTRCVRCKGRLLRDSQGNWFQSATDRSTSTKLEWVPLLVALSVLALLVCVGILCCTL